jgi:hypothetical protein
MPQMKLPVWLLLLFAALTGCRHRVTVVSDPLGAAVSHGRVSLGTTPTEVVLWKAPFLRYRVRVGHSGYRAVEVDLARGLRPWRARRQHEVILVREHGPSGTWDAEEAGE